MLRENEFIIEFLSDKQEQVYLYLEDDTPEELLFGGAAGGGKSVLLCAWQIARRLSYPKTRGLIGRNRLKDLKDTTLKTLEWVWDTFFNDPRLPTMNHPGNSDTIYFSNGSEIILRDLYYYPKDKEFTRIGSLDLTDAAVDEACEISDKAKTILKSRIRWKLINDTPKLLLCSNPMRNWLKHDFVADKKDKPIDLEGTIKRYIPARVQDNPDKKFAKRYEQTLNELPVYDRMRLLDGSWSVIPGGNKFFAEFRSDCIVPIRSIERNEELYLSWDFNYDPTTLVVGQKLDDVCRIYITHQAIGGTPVLAEETKELYMDHPGGLIVTGDHSGYARSSNSAFTDYQIIKDVYDLGDWNIVHGGGANLSHSSSRNICNYFLRHCNYEIVGEGNEVLIQDLEMALYENNHLKKDRDSYKMDACDAFRYLIHLWFPNINDVREYAESQREKVF